MKMTFLFYLDSEWQNLLEKWCPVDTLHFYLKKTNHSDQHHIPIFEYTHFFYLCFYFCLMFFSSSKSYQNQCKAHTMKSWTGYKEQKTTSVSFLFYCFGFLHTFKKKNDWCIELLLSSLLGSHFPSNIFLPCLSLCRLHTQFSFKSVFFFTPSHSRSLSFDFLTTCIVIEQHLMIVSVCFFSSSFIIISISLYLLAMVSVFFFAHQSETCAHCTADFVECEFCYFFSHLTKRNI